MTESKNYTVNKSGLSIVIPAYNAAVWLGPTLERLQAAVERAKLVNAEIIIVNDGSSDNTESEALKLAKESKLKIVVLSHENSGRFITRKRGVEAAAYEAIFFVDTRVWVDESALKYVVEQQVNNPDRQVWNGHVNVAKKGNVIARFGDALTFIGWRRYFSNPKLTSYGLKDFDYYPKGTGMFLVPKPILVEAIEWFESVTSDIRNSSDDTLLIRHIAERNDIWLSPDFSCTYHARNTFTAFVKHTFFRGKFFVDGFLRPGTRFYYPLLGFLVLSIATPLLVVFFPSMFPWLVGVVVTLWLLELIVSLMLRLNLKDALSLFILSPVFAAVYGLGIWGAVIMRLTK